MTVKGYFGAGGYRKMGQLKWWRLIGVPSITWPGYLSTLAGYSAYPGRVFSRAALYPAWVLRVLTG
jgi:hypothetical protein